MKSRNSKTRITLVAMILVAMFFVFAGNLEPSYAADGTNVNTHSKEEIVNYLKNNGVSVTDPVKYSIEPIKNTQKGELTSASEEGALKMLNNVRYIAGLNPVSLNTDYVRKAQAGAFSNYVIGDITHYPGTTNGDPNGPTRAKPDGMSDTDWEEGKEGASSSNLGSGYGNLNSAIVYGWMSDGDTYNIDKVGHRAWCINPKMGSTGFGKAGGYTAMWSKDKSGSGTQTNVAWPAQYMPVEYFDNNDPWSLFTGNTSITDISNVSVSLTRRSTSPSGSGSWSFSTNKSYTASNAGEYFGVQVNYPTYRGMPGAYVVFRPANITYKSGDIFDVIISGLGSSTISYTVEFFSGLPVESVSFAESEIYVGSYGTQLSLSTDPIDASGYDVQWESADESIATVDSDGYVEGLQPGKSTRITATIPGKYTSDGIAKKATCTIYVKKNISSGEGMSISIANAYYNGKSQQPEVTIKDGDTVLAKDVDYEVSYPSNAIEPTTSYEHIIWIYGKGKYEGNTERYMLIYKKPLTDCTIIVDPESFRYDGNTKQPSVAIKNDELTLIEGTDYSIVNGGGTNAGTYNITLKAVSGSKYYSGTVTKQFTIEPKEITRDMVETISDVTYNGKEQTPDVSVQNGATALVKGTDYTVTYSNNTDAGTATATVKGKGNYTGEIEKTFTIKPKPLDEGMVTMSSAEEVFTGSNQAPTITVKDGSNTLTAGTHYTLENNGGINAGEYDVKVTGKGNYTGEISETFTIIKKPLDSDMVTISPSSFTYNGANQKPDSVVVKYGQITLVKGDDYTLTNEGGTKVGEYEVIVSAKDNGNYSGSATKKFNIGQKPISSASIGDIENQEYDGVEKTPAIIVTDGSITLTQGDDYEIGYSNNIDAGTAKATITGKGNYSGETEKSFTIKARSIEKASIRMSGESFVYNGKAQKPSVTVKDGDKKLTEGTDYTLSGDGGINVGEYTLEISGKGNYTRSKDSQFTITPKDISTGVTIAAIPEQTLTDSAVKPAIIASFNGKALSSENDYDVTYENNDREGEGKATIKGKNNFTGEITKPFTIVSMERADLKQLISDLKAERDKATDSDYKSALTAAIDNAEAVANDPDATADQINSAKTAAETARDEAAEALREKEEKENENAKPDPKPAPGSDPNQKGEGGSAIGKGASAAAADKAITSSSSEEGPAGSKFNLLQLKSSKQTKTSIKLAWKKVKGARKYVIYGNACGKKNKMKKLGSVSAASKTFTKVAGKKVKKGTYYKFMVVALDSNNNVITSSKVVHAATKGGKNGNFSSVSITAKVDAKGKSISKYKALSKTVIRRGKSITVKAKAVPQSKKLKAKKHRKVVFESSDPKVAKVNSKGRITAKAKGSCCIYAYAQNGVMKKIRITVK